jgi:branched-chain amino acid transport system substrate-binding protein
MVRHSGQAATGRNAATVAVAAFAIVFGVLSGVGNASASSKTVHANVASSKCTKSTFKIPDVDEFTGAGGFLGVGNLYAVKLAENQINAKGGVDGHCLGYTTYDTTTSPTEASLIFRQLNSSALVILGPTQSTDAQGAFPVAHADGIPSVTEGVTTGSIISAARPWVWDTNILANASLGGGAKDFVEKTSAKSIAAIVDTQDTASVTQAAVIEAGYQSAGATVDPQIDVTSTQVDYSSEIAQAVALKPSAYFICDNPGPTAAMVNGLISSGVTAPINVCQSVLGTGFVGVVPANVPNLYVFDGTPYLSTLDNPEVAAFNAGIAKLGGGTTPGVTAANAYNAIYLIANSLERSGVLSKHSKESLTARRLLLRKALDSATSVHAAIGTFSIGKASGLASYTVGVGFFLQYENSSFVQVKA